MTIVLLLLLLLYIHLRQSRRQCKHLSSSINNFLCSRKPVAESIDACIIFNVSSKHATPSDCPDTNSCTNVGNACLKSASNLNNNSLPFKKFLILISGGVSGRRWSK